MKYNYCLLLFFCAFTNQGWSQSSNISSESRASSLFFTPRSRSAARSLRISTSLARAPIISRIARVSKTGFMTAAMGALGAVRAYITRQQVIPIRVKPEEVAKYNKLRADISDTLKKEERSHLIERGYPPLAPTTFSGHFEKYYPVERIEQLAKTEQLERQITKDYFPRLDSEKKELQELERQEKLLTQQQPSSWWQRLTGKKEQKQKELVERVKYMRRDVQEQETKKQKIIARIDALD